MTFKGLKNSKSEGLSCRSDRYVLSLLHANHEMGMHMALSQDLQKLNAQGLWKGRDLPPVACKALLVAAACVGGYCLPMISQSRPHCKSGTLTRAGQFSYLIAEHPSQMQADKDVRCHRDKILRSRSMSILDAEDRNTADKYSYSYDSAEVAILMC